MAGLQNGDTQKYNESSGEADMAQAFKDLARGEQTATALEAHLSDLERKIDELLAQADEDERSRKGGPSASSASDGSTSSNSN